MSCFFILSQTEVNSLTKDLKLDYHYAERAEQYNFYRIHKILFTDDRFKKLSTEAKVLYGLMLDRMGLSVKHKWYDEEERVYIYYSLEDAIEQLNCGKDKGVKLFAELDNEKGYGLIERKKQGQGKPTIIYVKELFGNSEVLTSEKPKSALLENRSLDFCISDPNNTNIINTDFNDTDISFIRSGGKQKKGGIDVEKYMNERKEYRELISNNIDFDILKERYPEQQLNEIIDIMIEAVCSTKQIIRVGQEEKPQELVKSQLLKLNSTHIECVIDCLNKNTSNISHLESYLLTVLYKSYYIADHRYKTWVQHDLYG